MNDSLHNYSKLHASEKEHLARLGIGKSQVDKMVKLLDDPKMSMHLGPDGGLKVPKQRYVARGPLRRLLGYLEKGHRTKH